MSRRVIRFNLLANATLRLHLLFIELGLKLNRSIGELDLAHQISYPLRFVNQRRPYFRLCRRRPFRPRFQVVNVILVDENRSACKSAGDNVSFGCRVEPSRNASADKVEAGVFNLFKSALSCRVNIVAVFPNVSQEGDQGFVEVGTADEGVELVSESASLSVGVFGSGAGVLNKTNIPRHEVNKGFAGGGGGSKRNFRRFTNESLCNVNCGRFS